MGLSYLFTLIGFRVHEEKSVANSPERNDMDSLCRILRNFDLHLMGTYLTLSRYIYVLKCDQESKPLMMTETTLITRNKY